MIGLAKLPLDQAAAPPTWLLDDNSPHYERADDVLDIPEDYVQRVFELYQQSYKSYGPPLFTAPEQLYKYDRWILFFDGDVQDADHLVAFALLHTTDNGLEAGLKGSDLSSRGRQAVKQFAIGSYNTQGVYGEISGRLETAILSQVPVVPFARAEAILRQQGKAITRAPTNDDHYIRQLKHLGKVTKIMVGKPI